MKNGKVVEAGDTKKLLSKPKHTYTQQLVAAVFDVTPQAMIATAEAS